jgi:glycosyltransferase involved in cell wall biosynthesis
MDLSILIPARNEQFLNNTIQDILKNKRGKTEIIVGLDGAWGESIPQHDDITVLYYPKAIGQRALTNRLAKLSKAKYVMKLDAHCAFDGGFDVKLMADMKDHWTVVPIMKNLHVFDWVCKCGFRRYQGPTKPCEKCGGEMTREMIWKGKDSPQSTSYRVNRELEFKYWGEYKKKQAGDIVDTFSLQGSCFMLTRDKYWELDICDENWGSWGGQGAEVALKTWLSGGEVKCNKKTWYAHLFRTQGEDFGFPYPNPGKEQKKAKDTLRDTFLNDKWPKAKYPLNWLINKFQPPEWEDVWKDEKAIIFYTDNQLNLKIAKKVQKRLKKMDLPIYSASLKPMPHFGINHHIGEKRGTTAYFKQILACLEACKEKIVYFCEHDVLYDPSHFEFTPPDDKFYFNTNVWKVRWEDGFAVKVDDCKQISGMVCRKEKALRFYRYKLAQLELGEFDRHYEPQKDRVSFQSKNPNYDIRHNNNLTKNRWSKDQFRNKKYTKGWQEKIIKL